MYGSQAACSVEKHRREMFVMHAFWQKAFDPAIMFELDQIVEGVSYAVELERQIRRKQSLSICWLGYEILESVSFRGNR